MLGLRAEKDGKTPRKALEYDPLKIDLTLLYSKTSLQLVSLKSS